MQRISTVDIIAGERVGVTECPDSAYSGRQCRPQAGFEGKKGRFCGKYCRFRLFVLVGRFCVHGDRLWVKMSETADRSPKIRGSGKGLQQKEGRNA